MKNNYFKSLFTLFLSLYSITSMAYDFKENGIYYNITSETDKTVEVTHKQFSPTAYSGSVVIPDVVVKDGQEYNVTAIGSYAFQNNSNLTSITIGNNVTKIGEYAFYWCNNLESLIVGNSVQSIGYSAFYKCYKLNYIINLSNLNLVKDSDNNGYIAYYINYSGTLLNAPNGKIIDNFIFSTMYGKNYVLKYLGNETDIILPESFNGESYIIGENLFNNNSRLTSIKIPNSVTGIESGAFSYCTGLTSIELPNSITSIGSSAFSNCTGLTTFVIPDSVINIYDYAFCDCTGLTDITIGNSVESIGARVFYGCTGLTSIEMPNSVTRIGDSAFKDCYNLNEVHTTDLAAWCNIYFQLWDSTPLYYAKRLYLNGEEITELVIPEGVTHIKQYAFENCENITSVTFPNSLTNIGNWVFTGCTQLKRADLGNGLTSLGAAFDGCTNLTEVIMPQSLTHIYSGAFADCEKLTHLTIPENVKYIDMSALVGCTGLTSVSSLIPADRLFEIDNYVFNAVDKNECTLYVPLGAKGTYATTAGWKVFYNIVECDFSGIDDVTVQNGSTLIYDLKGNRIDTVTERGIYIKDGKKVVIK